MILHSLFKIEHVKSEKELTPNVFKHSTTSLENMLNLIQTPSLKLKKNYLTPPKKPFFFSFTIARFKVTENLRNYFNIKPNNGFVPVSFST